MTRRTFNRFTTTLLTAAAGLPAMAAEARHILVHGHRGARARRPENTLPAFRYAIEQGVDFLELDVAVTKDGVPVVSHDPHINGVICSGPNPGVAIHDLTLEELHQYDCGAKRNPLFPDQMPVPGTSVPLLDEVFALGKGNQVGFNVETKIFADHPELTPAPEPFTRLILDLVRKHDLTRRVILQSFDPRTLVVMKKLDPSIPRAALIETNREWDGVAREFEATIISPDFHLVTPERVLWAHKNGLQVVPWTVDKPEDWAKVADAGVDAIISDDPAALMAWLKARGLR
jgi:glycerophosphoryl diester phosphodiesterase